MCVWLNVCIPPFAVSSSGSAEQFGRGEAGAATRLVRHERQCLDGEIDGEITVSSSLWMVGCGNDSGLWWENWVYLTFLFWNNCQQADQQISRSMFHYLPGEVITDPSSFTELGIWATSGPFTIPLWPIPNKNINDKVFTSCMQYNCVAIILKGCVCVDAIC